MAENKKRISIEVNADFHRELKLFATLRGMSIQSYITIQILNTMVGQDEKITRQQLILSCLIR